jgi:hypothetical protein
MIWLPPSVCQKKNCAPTAGMPAVIFKKSADKGVGFFNEEIAVQ